MALKLVVNGTGINQCGPLQESMLMLGVVTPHDIFKSPYTHTHTIGGLNYTLCNPFVD